VADREARLARGLSAESSEADLAAGAPAGERVTIRLWDLPVRLVHWTLVVLLAALWWTAEIASNVALHKILGTVMLGLIVFRLLWGFLGGSTARFGKFVRGPRAAFAYLRNLRSGEAEPIVGHNPIGGWSVVILLLLLAAQVTIGLFTQDVDGIESGPLSYLVSYDTADAARGLHGKVFYLLLGFVVLHLAAVLFYRFVHRNDLIRPMITGSKAYDAPVEAPQFAPAWRLVVCVGIAALFAWWVWLGCPIPGTQV
jgi:cytochrome b